MMNLFSVIRKNKLYAVLAVFIVLLNLAAFFHWKAEQKKEPSVRQEQALGEAQQEKKNTFFPEESPEERRKKIEKLAEENPKLYVFIGLFNLLVIVLLIAGIVLDIYLLARWMQKKPLEINILEKADPKWDIGDVARVTIIFLSFGYLFAILQGALSKAVPLFDNENFNMIFNTAVLNIGAISVIFYFISRKYRQSMRAAGIAFKGAGRSVYYAVMGYIALLPVMFLTMMVIFFVSKLFKYQPPVQPIVEVFLEEKETSVLWISVLFASIGGPVAEEIFFRGFMYPAVRKRFGVLWGMLSTSVLFALLHAHLAGFFPIAALGLLLTYLFEKTGSILPSITVHVIHNLGMVVMVFLMRYVN